MIYIVFSCFWKTMGRANIKFSIDSVIFPSDNSQVSESSSLDICNNNRNAPIHVISAISSVRCKNSSQDDRASCYSWFCVDNIIYRITKTAVCCHCFLRYGVALSDRLQTAPAHWKILPCSTVFHICKWFLLRQVRYLQISGINILSGYFYYAYKLLWLESFSRLWQYQHWQKEGILIYLNVFCFSCKILLIGMLSHSGCFVLYYYS